MKNKPALSVVLATFNEQDNIKSCLESVRDLASEIIIYDQSSTDKTSDIARKMGAKVYKVPHTPMFHTTKNQAIAKAKGDWILQLDADERLTPALKKEIEKLLQGKYAGYDSWISPLKQTLNKIIPIFKTPKPLPAPVAAYWLVRKNFFLKGYLKQAGQYPDPVIRLFQRGKAILPAKDVHEQMHVYGRVGWLKSDLDHYATPNFSRYLLRENRYSSLRAGDLYKQGLKINFFNTANYLIFKPLYTFLLIYFRYRGFLDGFPGFVFALYSGLHHAFSYMKLWEIYKNKNACN